MDVDSAFEAAQKLLDEALKNLENIVTEEDAKIQIIQRLLVECLGWKVTDIRAERKHESGFSDYILSDEGKDTVIVEAKRVGKIELKSADVSRMRKLKLSGPALTHCQQGIEQAAGYANPNGLRLAVLTDGLTWVIFKPHIEGAPYKEKKGFVFPSFNAILNDFPLFFDLLSKRQHRNKVYKIAFDKIHEERGDLGAPRYQPLAEQEIHIEQKSELAFDLEAVLNSFFSKISGDDDPDMLIECFVESQESRIADFSIEKMAANILGNIVSKSDVDEKLNDLITSAIDIDKGETVFIVGPTGSGKTTFLDRFFQRSLDQAIRDRCLILKVNCLDFSGQINQSLDWFTEQIITSIENQIFDEGIPNWDDLRGLYHLEYLRRIKGTDSKLYKKDKEEYYIKFGEVMEGFVERDREGYLKKLLSNLVGSRKMLPILVFDNTDEFGIDVRAQIFQYAQSLRRHASHCLLLFPVTDKSAWSFSKTDLYGIYQSKSFFLPTPPPREIFRRRVEYLRSKISEGTQSEAPDRKYLTRKGINISIEDLGRFAGVVEDIFVDQDYASRVLGEIANYNIRRMLLLSRRVITSSVFGVDEIIKSYVTGESIAPNTGKFMNALLRGDYKAYRPNDRHEVFSVFRAREDISQSPLMSLRVLALLESVKRESREIDKQHLTVQSIFDYFDALGASEAAVDQSLLWLLDARLIEPYDTSELSLSPAQRFATSHAGTAHLRLARGNDVFIEQLSLTTGLRSADTAERIKNLFQQRGDFPARMAELREAFITQVLKEDAELLNSEVSQPQYRNQAALLSDLRILGGLAQRPNTSEESEGEVDTNLIPDTIVQVAWFDSERGYGFVRGHEHEGDIFLHSSQLRESDIGSVSEGDYLRCAIRRSERGLSVAQVFELLLEQEPLDQIDCEVVKVVKERGFGFARVGGRAKDAYFSFGVFSEELRRKIIVGHKFRATIASDSDGRLRVREVVT